MLVKLFFFCYINVLVKSKEIPQQIHILFRHGERAPTDTYPNDPHANYKWEGGLGHLTNRGKLQMFTLGQNLRTLYKDFLPKYYWPVEVNFTSSYSERCLMSAELVGAGMFPPEDFQVWNSDLLWQPIPIHYLPRNLDNLMAMKTNCTEYDKEFLEVHNSSKIRQMNEEYQNLYNYLTEHTGMIVDNTEAVESLYNTLEIEQLNNLTLPYWVNATLMTQMRIIAAQNLAIYSETIYMKKMKGGFFLRTVLDVMKKATVGNTKVPSVNMYSGHDLTLVHVLRALNLVDTIKPDFGASLILERYENSEFKIFYLDNWAGSPREQNLNCPNSCTLENFEEAYKNVIPVNWADECKVRN